MFLHHTTMRSLYCLAWAVAVSATLNLKQLRPSLAEQMSRAAPESDGEDVVTLQASTAPLFLNDNTKSEH